MQQSKGCSRNTAEQQGTASMHLRCSREVHNFIDHSPLVGAGNNGGKPREAVGVARMLRSYMARYHAPALLKTMTQATVLMVFVGFFFLSIGATRHISR